MEVGVNRRRILLVEDESLIRVIVAESLTDAGYDVMQADSGEAAVLLLDRPGTLDLLLTDIQMPGSIDGNAVAQAAKKRHPGLPVIYVTGRPDSLQNGIGSSDAFIRKPFGPNEILTLIRTLLAKHQGVRPIVREANQTASYR